MKNLDFTSLTLPDLATPDVATLYLAQRLERGELMLLLGAGVSMSSGLPSWSELVEGCETAVGIRSPSGRSSQELMRAIDAVRRKMEKVGDGDRLLSLIRENLYPPDYLAEGTYPDDVVAQPMLIAIGALAMASSRGSVTDVFTFNFDDLLEWYLHLHGFTTQVVPDYPVMLRGDRDVVVYHPHGFLPLVSADYRATDWVVLSYSELVNRLSGIDAGWPRVIEDRLHSKVMLAVGTSMNDLDLDVLLRRVRSSVTDRPLGFAVLSKSADADADDKREALFERGVVPVELDTREQIPAFLLDICRTAARR